MRKQLNQILSNNISNTTTFTVYESVLGNFTKSVELELESNKHLMFFEWPLGKVLASI
jgi:hypothetical protein